MIVTLFSAQSCCPTAGWQAVAVAQDPRRGSGLPADPGELIALADQLFQRAPHQVRCLERGLIALKKARRKTAADKDDFEARWRLAWAAFLLAERLPAKEQRLSFSREGIAEAERAIAARPRRVEGHYYLAVNLGKLAEITGDVTVIPRAVAAAKQARRIDERFDRGGPLVFLGKVYLTAPPWPISVGNSEEAVSHLERALRVAPRPLTRLFLGEAYLEDERFEEALPHLERAVAERAQLPPRWRREAADHLRRVRQELAR